MKFEPNRRYTTIAIYAILVIAAAAAIVVGIVNYKGIAARLNALIGILSPFIIGFAIAYILNPLLKLCERFYLFVSRQKISRRMNRNISVLSAYLLALVALSIFFRIVIPQIGASITSLASLIPDWLERLQVLALDLIERYNLESLPASTVNKLITTAEGMVEKMTETLSALLPQLLQVTLSLTTRVINLVVGIIISIYLLLSKELFFAHIKKLLSALLPQRAVNRLLDITHESNDIFSGFIQGKLLDSLIIGILCFVVMSIFRWPYAMLISVIVGVTNIIPYFGPFIGAIPSILILLIVDPMTALWFALFILLLQQLDGNVIGPKILGDSTGLSAFWVIFAITLFGSLFGFVGMFIGVPLFAVLYSLVREFAEERLKKRELPVETDEYASQAHPIIRKKQSQKEKES